VSDDGAGVFRRFHEAWTNGDVSAVLSLVDPDFVARPLHRALFTRSEFRGPDGAVEWFREMTGPWDRFEALVEAVHDTPGGALGILRVVGYRGDEGFHARVGVECEVRDGRVRSLIARNATDVERELDGG
jgi:ketosteroid isomerase-like protein